MYSSKQRIFSWQFYLLITEKGAVTDYEIDLPGKTVSVTSTLSVNEVQDILAKSGKTVKHLETK